MACPVLVVEDDRDLRDMMAELLSCEGFETVVAANGKDALDVLHGSHHPHVILLDMMMPVMDGWTFRAIQRQDAELASIPVIVVTAVPESLVADVEAVEVLHKPLDFDHLIAAVRHHC